MHIFKWCECGLVHNLIPPVTSDVEFVDSARVVVCTSGGYKRNDKSDLIDDCSVVQASF